MSEGIRYLTLPLCFRGLDGSIEPSVVLDVDGLALYRSADKAEPQPVPYMAMPLDGLGDYHQYPGPFTPFLEDLLNPITSQKNWIEDYSILAQAYPEGRVRQYDWRYQSEGAFLDKHEAAELLKGVDLSDPVSPNFSHFNLWLAVKEGSLELWGNKSALVRIDDQIKVRVRASYRLIQLFESTNPALVGGSIKELGPHQR